MSTYEYDPTNNNGIESYTDEEFVGFWKRLLATMVDLALFLTILFIIFIIGPSHYPKLFNLSQKDPTSKYLIILIVGILYFAIPLSSPWGGTVGKKTLGLKVVDKNCNCISFLRALFRCAFQIIAPIGCLVVIFNKRKRALHDIICGTYVTKD